MSVYHDMRDESFLIHKNQVLREMTQLFLRLRHKLT